MKRKERKFKKQRLSRKRDKRKINAEYGWHFLNTSLNTTFNFRMKARKINVGNEVYNQRSRDNHN